MHRLTRTETHYSHSITIRHPLTKTHSYSDSLVLRQMPSQTYSCPASIILRPTHTQTLAYSDSPTLRLRRLFTMVEPPPHTQTHSHSDSLARSQSQSAFPALRLSHTHTDSYSNRFIGRVIPTQPFSYSASIIFRADIHTRFTLARTLKTEVDEWSTKRIVEGNARRSRWQPATGSLPQAGASKPCVQPDAMARPAGATETPRVPQGECGALDTPSRRPGVDQRP